MYQSKVRKVGVFLIGVWIGFSYQNCSPVSVTSAEPASSALSGNPTPAGSDPEGLTPEPPDDAAMVPAPPMPPPVSELPPSPSIPPTEVIQALKPSLAVRGISCMMCHAEVQANIITDFGSGDDMFFPSQFAGQIYGERPETSDKRPLTLPFYGNYYSAWQTANIQGTVFVPNVKVTDKRMLDSAKLTEPISLKELLNMDLGPGYYGFSPYVGNSGTGPMTAGVTSQSGNPKVQELENLYIGAPTPEKILSLSGSLSSQSTGWEGVSQGAAISGLSLVQGADGGNYVTPIGDELICNGDIVIKGTLFLNNVRITTTGEGCRLMVTQSVFIQGQILFSKRSGFENFQISSGRAILMGFSYQTLNDRLTNDWYNMSAALTRGPGTNKEKNASILTEAKNLRSVLHDSTESSSCPTSMKSYLADAGSGFKVQANHCMIQYERLLLNAPQIYSRYVGEFKGVAIAEIALFTPGALQFKYDTTFDSVKVLPKVISSVIQADLK